MCDADLKGFDWVEVLCVWKDFFGWQILCEIFLWCVGRETAGEDEVAFGHL